jgi:guanine deaminase
MSLTHLGRQAAELLFGIMMVGDDRAFAETWVMGQRLSKRA